MMKYCIGFFFAATILQSCAVTKTPVEIFAKGMEQSAQIATEQNSKLAEMAAAGALIIDYGDNNFAWTRTSSHLILVYQNKEWKGFNYQVSIPNGSREIILNTSSVNPAACDSVLAYINDSKAWNLLSQGNSFTCGDGKQCTINDANTSSLSLIWGNKASEVSVYAAGPMSTCCPSNENLKKFVTIATLINSAFLNKEGSVY